MSARALLPLPLLPIMATNPGLNAIVLLNQTSGSVASVFSSNIDRRDIFGSIIQPR